MELKGLIKLGDTINLNCCDSLTDILIGDVSLYNTLEVFFNLSSEEFWNDYDKESPRYELRYIISDNDNNDVDKSFNDAFTEHTLNILYGSLIHGCYSEWTCGYGGFDYLIENGRSVFKELESYVGSYIHLSI